MPPVPAEPSAASVPEPVAVSDRKPRVAVAVMLGTMNWKVPARVTLSRKNVVAFARFSSL